MKSKKWLLIVIVSCLSLLARSQQSYEISYQMANNGKVDSSATSSFTWVENIAYLSSKTNGSGEFIDFNRDELVDIMLFDDVLYKTVTRFDALDSPRTTEETENILGFDCSKVIYSSFSNTIEVWFTTEMVAKGSPIKSYLPDNGLVMKIVINGNRSWTAMSITPLPDAVVPIYAYESAEKISHSRARELQIKSRFTNVQVFDRQVVNFEGGIANPEFGLADTTYRLSNGTIILKKIKLPEINKKGASVFATLTNWSKGDAYDRTCSFFTVAEKKDLSVLDAFQHGVEAMPFFVDKSGKKYQGVVSTNQFEVPVELMRFFTSFGVSHFNHIREINNYNWQDSVVYKQEITSLIPNSKDEIWVGVFIGNYDKGGHQVSLDLQFYPAWEEVIPSEKWIEPLFNTLNILEASGQNYGRLFKTDTLQVDFDLPPNIDDLQLLFTSTGHGGWGGGDEFNPKLNQVFIDGKLVFSHIPWRTDCGTYRMSNPASGNFQNGLSSSDLSRSNWCPATLTPPWIVSLHDLKPGKHHLQVVIDQGDDEGNSFNHWSVSGVLTGTLSTKK